MFQRLSLFPKQPPAQAASQAKELFHRHKGWKGPRTIIEHYLLWSPEILRRAIRIYDPRYFMASYTLFSTSEHETQHKEKARSRDTFPFELLPAQTRAAVTRALPPEAALNRSFPFPARQSRRHPSPQLAHTTVSNSLSLNLKIDRKICCLIPNEASHLGPLVYSYPGLLCSRLVVPSVL